MSIVSKKSYQSTSCQYDNKIKGEHYVNLTCIPFFQISLKVKYTWHGKSKNWMPILIRTSQFCLSCTWDFLFRTCSWTSEPPVTGLRAVRAFQKLLRAGGLLGSDRSSNNTTSIVLLQTSTVLFHCFLKKRLWSQDEKKFQLVGKFFFLYLKRSSSVFLEEPCYV